MGGGSGSRAYASIDPGISFCGLATASLRSIDKAVPNLFIHTPKPPHSNRRPLPDAGGRRGQQAVQCATRTGERRYPAGTATGLPLPPQLKEKMHEKPATDTTRARFSDARGLDPTMRFCLGTTPCAALSQAPVLSVARCPRIAAVVVDVALVALLAAGPACDVGVGPDGCLCSPNLSNSHARVRRREEDVAPRNATTMALHGLLLRVLHAGGCMGRGRSRPSKPFIVRWVRLAIHLCACMCVPV